MIAPEALRTVAIDSGKVAIASVCFARTAAPMKIGIWQMTFSRGIAAARARCMI